jgi:hypothetical protein
MGSLAAAEQLVSLSGLFRLGPGFAVRALLLVGMVGLALRFWLAGHSIGSDDVVGWLNHARLVRDHGVAYAFGHSEAYNHPPLMGYWAAAASALSHERLRAFAFLIKLPGLLAELGTAVLLYLIWCARGGVRWGALAVATYGWALCSILVSGFHGNTDAVYAFLSLLAAYYASEGRSSFKSGLALAAALNVKLLPLLLIPPLAASCRSRRELLRFLGGLSLATIPYLPFVFTVGPRMYENMLAYNSNQDNWGLVAFLNASYATAAFGPFARRVGEIYLPLARYLVLLGVALVSLRGWRRRQPTYELCALSSIVFLVLTAGFGVQYTILLVPLLCAVSLGRGAIYAFLAGIFIGSVYLYFRLPGTPWQSNFWSLFPRPCALLGILAWGYLVETGVRLLGPPLAPAIEGRSGVGAAVEPLRAPRESER